MARLAWRSETARRHHATPWRYVAHAATLAPLLALLIASTAASAQQACRQALLLGLDVSLSVDPVEFGLQRTGLARALTSATVAEAILPRGGAHVELAVFEWSGPFDQQPLVGWTVIDSRATLARLARRLVEAPQEARLGKTGLGAAMRHARRSLGSRAHCARLTLDLSGDGPSNSGPLPEAVKPEMEAAGITVNGLVIGIDPFATGSGEVDVIGLARYYDEKVITGPAAFVEAVIGFEGYQAAMERKLLRELTPSYAHAAPPRPARLALALDIATDMQPGPRRN
ncbi:MAG: DUF1194 domain-containing protein [Roseovarius sp.]